MQPLFFEYQAYLLFQALQVSARGDLANFMISHFLLPRLYMIAIPAHPRQGLERNGWRDGSSRKLSPHFVCDDIN